MSAQRGRPPYPDILTPRQFEVLELVREGLSNGEIGRRLGISPDGAKFHVSEIITKLGVSTRREAAGSEVSPRERARPTARLRLGSLEVGGWRLERHHRAHRTHTATATPLHACVRPASERRHAARPRPRLMPLAPGAQEQAA